MEYFIFDTETTGTGNKDEVIQFAGIRLNKELKIMGMVNWYCAVPKAIPPDATAVHGITDEMLARLSDGNFLEDYLNRPENSWLTNATDLTFIAYNSRFDKRMVTNSLVNNGYKRLNFGRTCRVVPNGESKGVYNVCLMEASTSVFNYQYGNKKLSEVVASQTKYTEKELEIMLNDLCTKFKIRRPMQNYHDALYDSLALTVLFYSNRMYFVAK